MVTMINSVVSDELHFQDIVKIHKLHVHNLCPSTKQRMEVTLFFLLFLHTASIQQCYHPFANGINTFCDCKHQTEHG